MSIRVPLAKFVFQNNGLLGAASVAGGIANTFMLPQDTDNVVVKFTASTVGAGVSTIFQTSDNGGATWYDVARTSIVTDGANPEWLSCPVIGVGVRSTVIVPSVVAAGSVVTFGSVYSATGSSAASTIGQKSVSGLPIMGQLNRVFLVIGAAVDVANSVTTEVIANSQSSRS